jgi:hypothetical protein
VLDLGKARQLVKQLEKRLGCELDGALALMEAGLAHQPPKYDLLQEVNLANEGQYRGVVNGFAKMAKQSKTQVRGYHMVQGFYTSSPIGSRHLLSGKQACF